MAENKMEQVAAMFGKELNEEFKIRRCGTHVTYDAEFSCLGLLVNCHGMSPDMIPDDDFLKELILGYYEIVKRGDC